MKAPILGLLVGPGIFALAEAPLGSPDVEGLLKLVGGVVTLTAFALGVKHLAERSQKAAEAADQRASAVGGKVDHLRRDLHDLEGTVTEIRTKQGVDEEEIKLLRASRHDYIDKELSPRLLRFEENVEDEIQKFSARLAVVEALVRDRG